MRESKVASQFVEGLDYPITKDAIVEAASNASVDSTLLEALRKIPALEYSEPEELTQALNAAAQTSS